MVEHVTLAENIIGLIATSCIILGFAYAGLKKWFVPTEEYIKDKQAMEEYIDHSIETLGNRLAKEKADEEDFREQEKKVAEIKKVVEETTRNVSELSFSVRSLEKSGNSLSNIVSEFKQEMTKKIDTIQEDIKILTDSHHETQIQVEKILTILARENGINL